MTRSLPLAFVLLFVLVSARCISSTEQSAAPIHTAPAPPSPVATIIPATPPPPLTQVATVAVTSTVTLSTVTTPQPTTLALLTDSALRALIQDAKNKLDQLKDSDKADTIVISLHTPDNCEMKKSRELGYLIDANTGETFFVKGDYWSIDSDLFVRNMKAGHSYVILHTHPKMWTTCRGEGIMSLNTFSLADLAVASNLTERGYHIQKVIAVSDFDYEIYPKIGDDWRTKEEVYKGVDHIERFMEVKFSTYDPYLDRTFYDVDNLMPLLAKELNYTYTANHVVLA
ncbi:MAG: hypothetical protein NTW33_03375 [Methanoregula sp.]|nr:hypothetical protein [Methanoregula sp.]